MLFYRPIAAIAFGILILSVLSMACKKDASIPKIFKAQNAIVIIIDGPRYSETFSDTTHQNIPELYSISQQGVLFTNMYNKGVTNTMNGIAAITTGNYGALANNGTTSPNYNNYLYYFIKEYQLSNFQTWIISSKDKVDALKTCANCNHASNEIPQTNCGNIGLNTGYRNDSITTTMALYTLHTYRPKAMLIHFREPDYSGHTGVWKDYINGIKSTSKYTETLWNYLQTDSFYKNNTAVFITNDHGRHLDSIADGFASHGDNCEGCRHTSLVALGPDFPKGKIDASNYSQIDITSTINYMFRLNMVNASGKAIISLID